MALLWSSPRYPSSTLFHRWPPGCYRKTPPSSLAERCQHQNDFGLSFLRCTLIRCRRVLHQRGPCCSEHLLCGAAPSLPPILMFAPFSQRISPRLLTHSTGCDTNILHGTEVRLHAGGRPARTRLSGVLLWGLLTNTPLRCITGIPFVLVTARHLFDSASNSDGNKQAKDPSALRVLPTSPGMPEQYWL